MKKVIFVVQAYDREVSEGRLENYVVLEVFAKSEEDAIERAKKYIDRPFYRISQVIEK